MWILWRTKSGRRWIWEALIRLDVGAPLIFVSGDFQYVKWRKFDQIQVSLRFFLFPGRAGVCPSAGEFFGHGSNAGPRSISTFRRTNSGRHWIWEALIRLDVGI